MKISNAIYVKMCMTNVLTTGGEIKPGEYYLNMLAIPHHYQVINFGHDDWYVKLTTRNVSNK